jgi:hypothetical protein
VDIPFSALGHKVLRIKHTQRVFALWLWKFCDNLACAEKVQ